ncbi:hypothetical protein [Pseudomonas sp.]|uniref:hypothetical protein n=1 Tax=Pseudomonas sp. TaxID=306 RepID=UPI00289FF8F2|nr:hypothetical protein [Pseudomonas sp.]
MAETILSDVVFQAELRDYMAVPVVEQTAFFQSGVLLRNNDMNALLASPTNEFIIPFWLDLDSSIEPNYSNDVFTDVATPLAITSSTQRARAAYLNEGWATMELVKNITNQDPLDYVAGRLTSYWQRQAQRRVMATAIGLYNDNVASNNSDMVINANGVISAEAIIRAKATMGDYTANGLGVIAMHSAVFTQLSILNLIDFTPLGDQVPLNGRYQGMTVVVDDGMPSFAGATDGAPREYLSIVFKPGAIGYAEEQPAGRAGLNVSWVDERGNGGGVETLWTRRDMLIHPFGYKFLSATITGNKTETRAQSASWADLALATNWERVLDRKLVPMAFIRSTAA